MVVCENWSEKVDDGGFIIRLEAALGCAAHVIFEPDVPERRAGLQLSDYLAFACGETFLANKDPIDD